jgi:hypothetical protein
MLKKILTSPWTALITLALVVGLRVADPAFVESVRLRYFDTLITSKPTEVIGVSVVNIDEKALEQHRQFIKLYYSGQWKKALSLLTLCKNASPKMEKYYDAMEQRLLGGCPKDWAGYCVATSK